MKYQWNRNPQLVVRKGEDLHLSNQSLITLMSAVLSKGLPFRFKARGDSMMPFIIDGDLITVAPLRKSPRLGDILAFIDPSEEALIVHRALLVKDNDIYIQGDNIASYSNGFIPSNNILGYVIRIERNGHSLRFGLGFERIIIAYLSRVRWLMPKFLREMLFFQQVSHRNR